MILASFASEDARDALLQRLHRHAIPGTEAFGPSAPEDERSILPLVMLVAGVLGCAGGFFLQAWTTTVLYPVDIGGRPNLAWPSYIPFTFECGLMVAMIAGFLGFFVANRMPTLWTPVDESPSFRRAMVDRWFVVVHDRTDEERRAALDLLEESDAEIEDRGS